jgi:tight adherence protein B
MKKTEHILAYVICSILVSVIAYLFYHLVPISVVIGALAGIYLEKMYAESTIKKRKKVLRLQFKDFLSSMSVAVRAGNVEAQAVKSALKDLMLSYNAKADIVKEVENIVLQYEKGGVELKVLFEDFANRSDIEDIRSFAAIYSVIEGKSDRFGDILMDTESIISEKIEIEQEIETTITSAKSETMVMLIMPIVIVVAMSSMGSGLMDSLFTTMVGHLSATVALIIFGISYILAVRGSNIEV